MTLGGVRILVVEDEEGLAESLRRGLSADGHAVEVTHDGHRGLDLALAGARMTSSSSM